MRDWISIARNIPGWLSDAEEAALLQLSLFYSPKENPVVVELGSWQGKSSVLLGGGIWEKSNPRLFCIDPFDRDEDPEYEKTYGPLALAMGHSREDGFRRNIRDAGLAHVVQIVKGYSYIVAQEWHDMIDILFIDANHEYDSVHRDVQMWSRFVKPNGVIALHDVGTWPGPTRVMAEDFRFPEYSIVTQVDSLAWVRKAPALI